MCTPTVQGAMAVKTDYNLYDVKLIHCWSCFWQFTRWEPFVEIQNIAICNMSLGHATIEGNLEERGHA